MNSTKLAAWWKASRPPFYIATLIPLFAGWSLALRDGAPPRPGLFLLLNAFCLAVHLATNLANDYHDHLMGTDSGRSIGGSRALQEGRLTLTELRRALVILYSFALLAALAYLLVTGRWLLAPLVAFSLLSSYFYTAPPIRYGYRGLGEVAVGLNMGVVMTVGTHWVMRGSPSWQALAVSLPIAVMVASILYFQSIPDMETDAAVGKRTLTVRLGRRRAVTGLWVQWALAWVLISALVATRVLSPWALLSLLTVPLLLRLLRAIPTVFDWQQLDRLGGVVRRLYLANGLFILLGIRL